MPLSLQPAVFDEKERLGLRGQVQKEVRNRAPLGVEACGPVDVVETTLRVGIENTPYRELNIHSAFQHVLAVRVNPREYL